MQSRRIRVFTDRYPALGPLLWVLSLQYFVTQVIVARAWTAPFSLQLNAISDLGNTTCGTYAMRYVCSPLHAQMNLSFISLGLTMLIGAGLIYHEFKPTKRSLVGFTCLSLSAFGTILVGLFPENTILLLHVTGAGLAFLIGNTGLVILSQALDIPRSFKLYTALSGIVALTALLLAALHLHLGLGSGGLERVIAYPQTIWLIVFGSYMTMNRYRRRPA